MSECACTEHGASPCGEETDRVLSVDIDIRPVALCQECWYGCWLIPGGVLDRAKVEGSDGR